MTYPQGPSGPNPFAKASDPYATNPVRPGQAPVPYAPAPSPHVAGLGWAATGVSVLRSCGWSFFFLLPLLTVPIS